METSSGIMFGGLLCVLFGLQVSFAVSESLSITNFWNLLDATKSALGIPYGKLPADYIIFVGAQDSVERMELTGPLGLSSIGGYNSPNQSFISNLKLSDNTLAKKIDLSIEGSSFKRLHAGGGSALNLLDGGGLFSNHNRVKPSTSNYPLYGISPDYVDDNDEYDYLDDSASLNPSEFGSHFPSESESHYPSDSSSHYPSDSSSHYSSVFDNTTPISNFGLLQDNSMGRSGDYRRGGSDSLGLNRNRLNPPFHGLNQSRPTLGLGNSYQRSRPATRFSSMCCADCPKRSIQCLAVCVRTGCNRVETCGNAGKGAYAAYCQSRCNVINGMSFNSVDFLPDEACRGFCAGNVQDLCSANSCTDYGCYSAECNELAPLKCL